MLDNGFRVDTESFETSTARMARRACHGEWGNQSLPVWKVILPMVLPLL